MITLENKRVHDYIVDKDKWVSQGMEVSKKLEKVEKEIADFEKKEKAITAKIEVKDLKERGDKLNDECQKKFEELQSVIKQIEEIKLKGIPKDIKEAHLAKMKEREQLERERNKIFMKVQKIKDRVIPIIQKEVKPLLKEYDDIETAKTKDGKVILKTFNHLEEFKAKFK